MSHPRGPSFTREEREGIGGENERESLTVCEGTRFLTKVLANFSFRQRIVQRQRN